MMLILNLIILKNGINQYQKMWDQKKNQPFYHLLAENNEITYEAYVSEQNLVVDDSDVPIKHPLIEEIFTGKKGSSYFRQSNWLKNFCHKLNNILSKVGQNVGVVSV